MKRSSAAGEEVFAIESKRDMRGEPQPNTIEMARDLAKRYNLVQGLAWLVARDLQREWGIQNGWLER